MSYYLELAFCSIHPFSIGNLTLETDNPRRFISTLRKLADILNRNADFIEKSLSDEPEIDVGSGTYFSVTGPAFDQL